MAKKKKSNGTSNGKERKKIRLSAEDQEIYDHLELDTIGHPKKEAFLLGMAKFGSPLRTSKITGISRSQHYLWMKQDRNYAACVDKVKPIFMSELVDSMYRRATEGIPKAKFDKNGDPLTWINPDTGQEETYLERTYSDTLAIFLLKSWDPQTYGDKPQTESNSHNQINAQLDELNRLAESYGITLSSIGGVERRKLQAPTPGNGERGEPAQSTGAF